MTALRRLLQWFKWIVRAVIFFALLAFALNNQQEATLNLMFGHEWRAPMTLIVLAAFALGLVVGVLGMLPGLCKRRATPPAPEQAPTADQPASAAARPD